MQRAFLGSSSLINLNAAGISPQPISVQDAVIENYRFANEIPTVNMWEKLDDNRKVIRQKLAELADCSVDEVALNRNSTEGLCTAIYGIDLKPGDEKHVGEKFGMIKLGSRTELVFPKEEGLELLARLGDKVKAGMTVIARYRPEGES